MADIELIIKLDEKLFKDIYSDAEIMIYGGMRSGKTLLTTLMRAIRNGKMLPKGHGELKDADAMINKLCTNEASELFGSITCAEIMDFINNEKPIIEADKEE